MIDPERCVFDVANDNVDPFEALLDSLTNIGNDVAPTSRVSGKTSQKFEKVDGQWVPIAQPKAISKQETKPGVTMAVRGEWVGDEFFPEMPLYKVSKARVEEKKREEKIVMDRHRRRFAFRQSQGDPAYDNDNESWPLLTALKREGDNDSVSTVLRYRELVALCECEPLQGQRVGGGDLSAVRRQNNLEAESEAAIAKAKEDGWKTTQLPGGEIRYKEVKKRKGGTFHLPAQQAVTTNDETRVRTAPIAMPFNCDLLIRQIDAKPVLEEIRAGLGPLLDPFEDAVLGGRTYTQIGKGEGVDIKPDVAGRALVKRAIIAVEGMMEDIAKRIRAAERAAEHQASLRRCQIAVENARYFGKAA